MLPPPFAPSRDLGSRAGPSSASHGQALVNIGVSPELSRPAATSVIPVPGVPLMWDGGPIVNEAGPSQPQPHSHSRYNAHRLVLEEVLPRETAVYIVSLYFDYVG